MENNQRFAEVWPKIMAYLNDGISLIAVREKADSKNPNKYPAKTPFGPWKMYQGRIMSENELFYLLDKYDSTSTAFVLG